MPLKILLSLIIAVLPSSVFANNQAPWVGTTLNGNQCFGGEQGFGPYDYTSFDLRNQLEGGSNNQTKLSIVEHRHFTPNVENLIKGETGSVLGDLNYTLRAWPNHHRALVSIIKYQLNVNNKLITGKVDPPPECYLQRAIHFSPRDAISFSLYGYYLHKIGQMEAAVKYYNQAMTLDPNNSKLAYSYGLLLIDLKRYDQALKYAKIAYQDKKAPNGLKQKLQKLNAWSDTKDSSEKSEINSSDTPAN